MSNSSPPAPAMPAQEVGRLEPLRPLPLDAVQGAMDDYQRGLHALLVGNDWQVFADRTGHERRFVKRTGWRKVATWFGLDLRLGHIVVERVAHRICPSCGHAWLDHGPDGAPLRARVVGAAVAPNGRTAEDVAVCDITERNFSKPEHDLVATAATRALNRATSNLVGMGELSAEEVGDDEPPAAAPLPEWAEPASDELLGVMLSKLATFLGPDRAAVFQRAVANRYGYVPNITTGFVNAFHTMLGATRAPDEGES